MTKKIHLNGIYHGKSDPVELIDGKTYEIVGVDEEAESYSVIDEEGEDYMYPIDAFEIIE